ncbi:hypothetical protein PMIN04_005011 [Paraphaeosphaeria minitans]
MRHQQQPQRNPILEVCGSVSPGGKRPTRVQESENETRNPEDDGEDDEHGVWAQVLGCA